MHCSKKLKACRNALDALKPRYRPGGFIGRGSFGIVYEIFDSEDGNRPYAVKIVAPHTELEYFVSDDAIRELRNTLSVPRTPYVISFREVFILSNFVVLFVMTRYDCTLTAVFKHERLNAACVRSLFCQLVAGLGVLHAADICHRDLKPANIFIDIDSGGVVIGDLGVARDRLLDYADGSCGQLTGEVATCGYAPIETLLPTGRYTASMDMWALGVILCEAMLGRQPFPQCVDRAAHARIILGVHGVPGKCLDACPHCEPGGSAAATAAADITGCTRWFLQEVCMQVISAAASPSRVLQMLQSEEATDDADARELVLGMLQYVPGRRLDIAAVARAPYVASFDDEPSTRVLTTTTLTRLRYHCLGTGSGTRTRRSIAEREDEDEDEDACDDYKDDRPGSSIRVLTAFRAGEGAVLTPATRLTWPFNREATRSALMHLLAAFMREEGHRRWCIEAWLMALATASILSRQHPPPEEGIERLAAYITYGLSCVTPLVLEEPYNRFQWLDDLPGTVDIVHVARQEAYITGELGKRRLIPSVNTVLLKRARRTLLLYSEMREFCSRTVRGGDGIRTEEELLLYL